MDPSHYVVHDDLFWTRTAAKQKKRRVARPPPHTGVTFPDEATISAFFGHTDKTSAQRRLREEVIVWQREQGYTAPLLPDIAMRSAGDKVRANGLHNAVRGDSGAVVVECIGDNAHET